jgi:DNA-binding transcriptional LysR family regulator
MVMDRLREMAVFVAVADAGGFARAAERLHASAPAVTRTVAALEARLGTRLFQRTTRSLRLTEAGQRLLDPARRLLADADAAERAAVGETAEPAGHLNLTAPVTFGRLHVAPVLAAVLTAHPKMTATMMMADRVVSLAEEGLDAAVRIGELDDSSLIATRVGETRRVYVASPGYLAERGAPASPAALKDHALIAFAPQTNRRTWAFLQGGRAMALEVSPRIEVNDAMAALALAEGGGGIASLLGYQAAEALAAGRVAEVLTDFLPPARPVHILHDAGRLVPAKLRAFLDIAAPALRTRLARA